MEWAEFLQGMSGDPQMLSAEYLDLIRLTKTRDEDLTMKINSEFTTEDPGNTWKIVQMSYYELFRNWCEPACQLCLLPLCVHHEYDGQVDGATS